MTEVPPSESDAEPDLAELDAAEITAAATTLATTDFSWQGRRAGIVSRCVAAVLDLGTVAALIVGGYFVWTAGLFVLRPRSFSFPSPSLQAVGSAYLVVGTLYLAGAWTVTGRSFGKQVMGLRVLTAGGERLRLLRALIRAIVCLAFPVGLLWVAFSGRNRALHDILLRTAVAYDWTTGRPSSAAARHRGATA